MIRELEFRILCRRHADDVYRYARSMLNDRSDAEDAVQEVLLRLWKHLPKVKSSRARLWLLRTTRNYCIDQIRRRGRGLNALVVPDSGDLVDSMDELAADPSRAADSDAILEDIDEALGLLPETLRSTFILYEINGLRYREIADTLGIPVNSVKVHLFRARRALQQHLKHHQPWMNAC